MTPVAKRKNIKLEEGDILQLSLPDDRSGYAVIIDRGGLPSGGTPYIAVFSLAYTVWPGIANLENDTFNLAGWTTDALVYHSRWKIVAHDFPVRPIPLPNFKVKQGSMFYVTDFRGKFIDLATPVELDLLNYHFSVSAGIFQDAFEALHGFGVWKDYYEKLTIAHARNRMTRAKPA